MDIALAFTEAGSGTPLILLHGNGEDGTYFAPHIAALARHFRVIALDTRGHGKSPRGSAPFTIAQFARDLRDFMDAQGIEKASLLYDYLDESRLFKGTAEKEFRSRMNVTFVTGDKDTDAAFVKEAAAHGLVNLKGHRLVGGIRASIYNAMPIEGVRRLVDFMKEFEAHA